MDSLKPVYRPYASWTTEEVEIHACDAATRGDIETLSYCLAELSPKYRRDTLSAWLDVIEFAKGKGLEPVYWLEKAIETTAAFTPRTAGKHNLYIILLARLNGKKPGYGLYVGETSKSPEDRFQEHARGKRNRKGPLFSRVVRRHHLCLLPSLYSHLNPLSRAEAKKLEGEITDALRQAGIPVYGGH